VLAEALDRAGGAVDAPTALGILDSVRQAHTRWSVAYGLKTGEVRLVTAAGGGERTYRLPMS
jgi:choloylglycine hydrolase